MVARRARDGPRRRPSRPRSSELAPRASWSAPRSAGSRPTDRCTSVSRPRCGSSWSAALALAVSGLAMSAAVTVRSRRLEFARLQALGATRSGLVRSVLVEHAILGTVGVVVGVALGALLAHVVAPLITTSRDRRTAGPRRRGPLGLARPARAARRRARRPRGARRRGHHEHAPEARLGRAAAPGGRAMTHLTAIAVGLRAATSGATLVARRRSRRPTPVCWLLTAHRPGRDRRRSRSRSRASSPARPTRRCAGAVVDAGTSADLVARVGAAHRVGFGTSSRPATRTSPPAARTNAASVHDGAARRRCGPSPAPASSRSSTPDRPRSRRDQPPIDHAARLRRRPGRGPPVRTGAVGRRGRAGRADAARGPDPTESGAAAATRCRSACRPTPPRGSGSGRVTARTSL